MQLVDPAAAGLVLAGPRTRILVGSAAAPAEELARITHLGIGAHQDDLEFMAFHGIQACVDSPENRFGGVTCTDGRGSARAGAFAHLSDDDMTEVRQREQEAAARLGGYGAMIQLGYTSANAKTPHDARLRQDLLAILRATRPRHVYMHNLADKQETHIAVAMATLWALRALTPGEQPETVWGCEVWRDLDWLPDERKVLMDVSPQATLAAELAAVFASQLSAKRYDLAVIGRRSAHATLGNPVAGDKATQVILGMDLMPLVLDPRLDVAAFIQAQIRAFEDETLQRLRRYQPHDPPGDQA